MRVRFWGTRGSVPTPGAHTVRYGGNTSCVEVRAADGTIVILDCGTGAIPLGRALLAEQGTPLRGAMLIGHTHWDHIQGFPFFSPLFFPGNHWEVYGPEGLDRQITRGLDSQMVYEHFPLSLRDLNATLQIRPLLEGAFEVGSIRVTTQYLNHPVFSLGYRLQADGVTLVYATDFEPFALHPLDASQAKLPAHHEDQRHIRFLENADLLIHDAQYTLEDFPAKTGWGHMPMEHAVDYAILAKARCLALFHHDPLRDDKMLDQLLKRARQRAKGYPLQVCMASEGRSIELLPHGGQSVPTSLSAVSALRSPALTEPGTILIVGSSLDPECPHLHSQALRDEGIKIVLAADGATALQQAQQEAPAVMLLDMTCPGLDGLALCRAWRAATESSIAGMPIMLLTETALNEQEIAAVFQAGASDYLAAPVKSTLVRSRLRIWLQRALSNGAHHASLSNTARTDSMSGALS